MNHRKSIIPVLLAVAFLVGCSTLYTGVVSITSVVDTATTEWSNLSIAGKTTPEFDALVIKAHDKYRVSCGIAKRALVVYKSGGDQANYLTALEAAKVAADGLLDIIYPLLSPDKADALKGQLAKANTP
jgi:hypothetical protein